MSKRTIYGDRSYFDEEQDDAVLTLMTIRDCRLRRLRIDGSDGQRNSIAIKRVLGPDGTILLGPGGQAIRNAAREHYVHVGTLEKTRFDVDFPMGSCVQVVIDTWRSDIEVCLVADVEVVDL